MFRGVPTGFFQPQPPQRNKEREEGLLLRQRNKKCRPVEFRTAGVKKRRGCIVGKSHGQREDETQLLFRQFRTAFLLAHPRATGNRPDRRTRRHAAHLRVQMEWKGKEQPTQSIRKLLSELDLRGHHPGKLLDVRKISDRA